MTLQLTQDDLQDLSPTVEEIHAADATTSQQDEQEDEYEIEEEDESNEVFTVDAPMIACHEKLKEAAPIFQDICQHVDEYEPFYSAMKHNFQIKRGYGGRKLKFPDYADAVYGKEYFSKLFNRDYDHVNRLFNSKVNKKDLDREVPTEKVRFEDTPRAKKMFADGREFERNQMIAKGVDVKQTIADICLDKPAPPPAIDPKDVYAYFSQLEKEPQTVAFETVAMYEAIGFDRQQINAVIELMKKQNNPRAAKA